MPSKKINNALATLVEGGYLTKLQAKKLVFKQVESELTFLQRKKPDAAGLKAWFVQSWRGKRVNSGNVLFRTGHRFVQPIG